MNINISVLTAVALAMTSSTLSATTIVRLADECGVAPSVVKSCVRELQEAQRSARIDIAESKKSNSLSNAN